MDAQTLADVHEDDLLEVIFPTLPTRPEVRLGVGDDAALLAAPTGAVLVTTDSMVLGRDFLDEWSDGVDVGRKLVTQNIADIAAMGGYPTAVVVSLMAGHDTTVAWCREFNDGVAQGCSEANVAVVGGDLSSAPRGSRSVSITALGELAGPMVLRSGAKVGDVVAVSDPLGRSDAGLRLLREGCSDRAPDLVEFHRRPVCRVQAGPQAALGGATAMMDVSDGLVRDARRIASSSGVRIELSRSELLPFADLLTAAVGVDAWTCVLSGGEEHCLLACFPAARRLPDGWTAIGEVMAGAGVHLDGQELGGGGWDHFGQ